MDPTQAQEIINLLSDILLMALGFIAGMVIGAFAWMLSNR